MRHLPVLGVLLLLGGMGWWVGSGEAPIHPPPPPPRQTPPPIDPAPPPNTIEVTPPDFPDHPTLPPPDPGPPTPPIEPPAPSPPPPQPLAGGCPKEPQTPAEVALCLAGDWELKSDSHITFMVEIPGVVLVMRPGLIYAEEGIGITVTRYEEDPTDPDLPPLVFTERFEVFRFATERGVQSGVRKLIDIAKARAVPLPSTIVFGKRWLLLGRPMDPIIGPAVVGRFRTLFPKE